MGNIFSESTRILEFLKFRKINIGNGKAIRFQKWSLMAFLRRKIKSTVYSENTEVYTHPGIP